jgi:hypothetical protein
MGILEDLGLKPKRQPIASSQKNKIWDRQNGKCAICGKPLQRSSTHYDHIKEVSKGGLSTTSNLRAVCADCHYQRHNEDRAKKADERRKSVGPIDIIVLIGSFVVCYVFLKLRIEISLIVSLLLALGIWYALGGKKQND